MAFHRRPHGTGVIAMSFRARLAAWINLLFIWAPVQAHMYEDNLGGQISLLGPLVCFAVFIAICACFCRECRRREALMATTTTVPVDPFNGTGPMPYGPAVAGARPVPLPQPAQPPYGPPYGQPPAPSQGQPPPPGFLGYPYGSMPQDPPPPYEYK